MMAIPTKLERHALREVGALLDWILPVTSTVMAALLLTLDRRLR